MSSWMIKISAIICLFLCITFTAGFCEEYKVGAEDVLTITFWQQSDLNTTATVRQDGKIALPVIGEIVVAGLTTEEISRNIVDKMSYYNPNISQATVVVSQYNSRRVYVTGQVNSPQRLSFEVFGNVWEAIQMAGGPTEFGDLSRVQIVRADNGEIQTVNLEKLLKDGNLSAIPTLRKNDYVEVPRIPGVTEEGFIPGTFEGRNMVFVYGGVARPGFLSLDEGMDVLDAIVLSGGPTPDAKLDEVRIISKDEIYSQVIKVDLDKYSKKGYPSRILLKPEDTIYIPQGTSLWGKLLTPLRDVLPLVTAVTSTVVAISVYNIR
jgi:protein involved in polysaccharide export with SLBB domain